MQLSLSIPVSFSKEAYDYGSRSDGGTHGLVLTKPHVVELILDLAGYASDLDLASRTLLEPSCGHGAFLVPAAERLLRSARAHGKCPADLGTAIAAFDIEPLHVERTREALVATLQQHDVGRKIATGLAEQWVRQGDFLLAPLQRAFDCVVGNPPYIRIEQLSPEIQAEYRRRYSTLFDRADLYVAFIERSLSLLSPNGVLSFVCADRWTLNRYGAPLRKLITSRHEVRTYIDLHQASPFESEVIAYPSIFAISRERTGTPVRVFTLATASPAECATVRDVEQGKDSRHVGVASASCETWFEVSAAPTPSIVSPLEAAECSDGIQPDTLARARPLSSPWPAVPAAGP